MPFIYELKIAAERAFVHVCAAAWCRRDRWLERGRRSAPLTDGAMEFHVPAPKQGLLVEWFVEHGAVIENMDSLARIVC